MKRCLKEVESVMEHREVTPTTECSLLKQNPVQLKQLVDCIVEVTSVDNKKTVGRVYTIDPVSNSVVLFKADGSVEVVIGHAVKHIELSTSNVSIPRLNIFSQTKDCVDENVNEMAKIDLKRWLLENKIPVEEEGGVLMVNKTLSIYPPYGYNQCVCTNAVMLEKIQHLISLMPKDRIT